MNNIIGKTSIVFNSNSKMLGLPPYYYRHRGFNNNLNGNTPAEKYQKQKIIQKTVRVQGSLYTSNLGSLSSYKNVPQSNLYGVCWNQMSDRPVPSVQRATIPTGQNSSMNRRHTSVTSSKPGSQTPGGIGCDIKHNSYDRYLNRLKGKGPLRRGLKYPYGVKTNIVNGCNCNNNNQDILLYNNPNYFPEPGPSYYVYKHGDLVYAKYKTYAFYSKGIIISISDDKYTVKFDIIDSSGQETSETQVYTYEQLLPYFKCDLNTNIDLYENNNLCNV